MADSLCHTTEANVTIKAIIVQIKKTHLNQGEKKEQKGKHNREKKRTSEVPGPFTWESQKSAYSYIWQWGSDLCHKSATIFWGATSLTLWSWNLCTEHLSWTGPQLRIFTYIFTFMLHNPSFRQVLSCQISDRKQGQREGKWLTKSHSSWMTVFSFHFHWGYCCYKLKMDSVPCSEKSLYSFWLDTWWKVYFSQDHFDCVKDLY